MQPGVRRGGIALYLPVTLLSVMAVPAARALPSGETAGSWPEPVARFIRRSDDCMHFAGEFNGDHSPRDAAINRRMDVLRCNSLPSDLQALRQRYRADAAISARLATFDQDGMPNGAASGH